MATRKRSKKTAGTKRTTTRRKTTSRKAATRSAAGRKSAGSRKRARGGRQTTAKATKRNRRSTLAKSTVRAARKAAQGGRAVAKVVKAGAQQGLEVAKGGLDRLKTTTATLVEGVKERIEPYTSQVG
jgi:hypothetical protein